MIKSVVLIAPAAFRAELNMAGEALGYGPQTFSVELSATGLTPATHYGTHTWAQPGGTFVGLAESVLAGQTPAGLEAHAAALSALSVRIEDGAAAAAANWAAALTAAGLSQIAAE